MALVARDFVRIPTLVSLTRLPLAIAFVVVRDNAFAALALLLLAGLSDVLDGYIARKMHLVSDTGALVDGAVDKVFVVCVAVAMLLSHRLPLVELLLLGVRDFGEVLLLLVGMLFFERGVRREHPHANRAGKATTVAQFATIIAALFAIPTWPFVAFAVVLGTVTVALYARELRRLDRAR